MPDYPYATGQLDSLLSSPTLKGRPECIRACPIYIQQIGSGRKWQLFAIPLGAEYAEYIDSPNQVQTILQIFLSQST